MKKEFKGTQGEWITDGCLIIDKPSDFVIADCFPETEYTSISDVSKNQAKANAKLISYAPEMFEKLEECIVMLNKKKRLTTTDMSIMIDEINELLTKATAI